MWWVELVGYTGLLLLLLAFLLQAVRKRFNKNIYNVLNILGALLMMIYAIIINNIIFTSLEGSWLAIAIYSLVKGRTHKRDAS